MTYWIQFTDEQTATELCALLEQGGAKLEPREGGDPFEFQGKLENHHLLALDAHFCVDALWGPLQ